MHSILRPDWSWVVGGRVCCVPRTTTTTILRPLCRPEGFRGKHGGKFGQRERRRIAGRGHEAKQGCHAQAWRGRATVVAGCRAQRKTGHGATWQFQEWPCNDHVEARIRPFPNAVWFHDVGISAQCHYATPPRQVGSSERCGSLFPNLSFSDVADGDAPPLFECPSFCVAR